MAEVMDKVFYSVARLDGDGNLIGYVYDITRSSLYTDKNIESSAKCTLTRAKLWLALCRDVLPNDTFKLVRSTFAVEIVDEE